jgi:hypothetical protein
MDAETSIGRESSSELRQQIQQTQADLGSKIEALEGEVRSVATQARERVRERVGAVQDVVDVRRHVQRRPVLTSAIALGAGVCLGMRRSRTARQGRVGRVIAVKGPHGGGLWSAISPEIATLRALLVGRALGFVGEMVRDRMRREHHPEAERPEVSATAPIQ